MCEYFQIIRKHGKCVWPTHVLQPETPAENDSEKNPTKKYILRSLSATEPLITQNAIHHHTLLYYSPAHSPREPFLQVERF